MIALDGALPKVDRMASPQDGCWGQLDPGMES
jgi:hypothetical protein